MENKKYVLTDETMEFEGHILHRIKSTPYDAIGGWVESEYNLSQEGNCWIGCDAKVYGTARVINNAYVSGNAMVYGKALVGGNARVINDAKVYDDAIAEGNAMIYMNAEIYGNATVMDNAYVYDGAKVYGRAIACGNARVSGNARLYGNTKITGHTVITENADVSGSLVIFDDACIGRDAVIRSKNDYLFIRNNFSSCRGITWTKSNDMYRTGCFYGTAEELIAKAEQDDERAAKMEEPSIYITYCKADYFRALIAMVEAFKKINEKDNEIKKFLENSSK